MSNKIKAFIECALPTSFCNLDCSYCWVKQANKRDLELSTFDFPVNNMINALTKKRFGGSCLFSLCALGETLLQTDLIELVSGLLRNGHYVNLTTNGTVTKKLQELLDACERDISHLHLSFSFHYTELLKKGLLDRFFDNIDIARKAGASFLLQLNLVDEYIPYIEDIKEISLKRCGAYPQIALTRDQTGPMKIFTGLKDEEYFNIGTQFNSPLFNFTYENFNVKRNEFCYAGDWTFVLDMKTGFLRQCYCNKKGKNIFEDINKPIKKEAVGYDCLHCYCVNSSHFMSLGVIPSIKTPTYASLRNRKTIDGGEWMSEEFKEFTNSTLKENNHQGYYKRRLIYPIYKKGIIKMAEMYNSMVRKR